MNVGELFIKLGFDVDDGKLQKFDNQIINVRNDLFGVKEYALAATYAIGRFVEGSIKGTADLKSFTDQTDLSAQALQDWQNVGTQLNRNLSPEAITGSIKSLQDKITEIQRFGTGNILPFQAFGIDVMDTNAFDTLEKIRKVINQFDKPTATNLLKQLGLDPNFISLLKVAPGEFEELAKNLRLTTDQQDRIDLLGQTIARLTLELTHFKDQVVAQFGPEMVEGIEEVVHVFGLLVEVLGHMGKALQAAGGWSYILYGLAAAIAAVTAPITLTAAAIGVLLGALDQLDKFIHGKKNIFDDFNAWLDKMGVGAAIARATQLFIPGNPGNIVKTMADANAKYGDNSNSGPGNTTKTQNVQNTFNIHSNAEPQMLSQTLANQFETTLKQLNNGAAN